MNIIEYSPDQSQILDFVNDHIRNLREAGAEAKYIVMGPVAYERMRKAIAERFNRTEGSFETYQYLPIVVDPFREDSVSVLPSPMHCAKGVHAHRVRGE